MPKTRPTQHDNAVRPPKAIPAKPLLVIVGGNDEVFHAKRFASVISWHQHSESVVIEGESRDIIAGSSAALRSCCAASRCLCTTGSASS